MRDELLATVQATMSTQYGLITANQLDELGVDGPQRRAAMRRGLLFKAAPGVYASPASTPTVNRDRLLGLLTLGPGAVLSHEAAAALHGFDRTPDGIVEFSVPRHLRGRRPPVKVHTTEVLPTIDRVVVDGWPCTSATRTVIDLARARCDRRRLEAAIDSAVRSGRSAPVVLRDRLADLRGSGRWGARRLDELLVDSGGHTMLERRFLELCREAGLPRPLTQVVHRDGGRTYARVDFYFADAGVVVEVSGRKGHSSPSERARDAQRRNELQAAGRIVYEYTWEDITQRAARVAAELRDRLRLRHQKRAQ